MKCHQCERPVFYQYKDEIGLCLICHNTAVEAEAKQKHSWFLEFLANATMLNVSNQELDRFTYRENSTPLIPVGELAKMARRPDYINNSLEINNSNIGVLNSGDAAKIDAIVTITEGTDAEILGKTIQELTQNIVQSEEISDESKNELGEHLAELTQQVTGRRSKSIIMSLLKGIEDRIKGANATLSLFQKLDPLIQQLFT